MSSAPTIIEDFEEKKVVGEETSPDATLDYNLRSVDAGEPVEVSEKEARSQYFAIIASGAALISDGWQNNLMSSTNLLYAKIYGAKIYTSVWSTRVSNALLVGMVLGQIVVGLVCDRIGRKSAILSTTLMIVAGGIIAAASSPAHADNMDGFFWMLTIARGIIGFGTGGEYPAASTSALEGANARAKKNRGPIFILVTNLVLSIGGPLCMIVFLIALAASKYDNSTTGPELHKLEIIWRIMFAIGCLLPLMVLYFRLKMLNSELYVKTAMRRKVPYKLAFKRYWKTLIGTAGTWFLYDFVTFPNGIFSSLIISSVIKDSTVMKTAEWTLLLNILSIPGVFVGAWLVNYTGRRWLFIYGFSGYLGCAWDKVINIVPLFIILYGLMNSMANMGPGNCCGLVSAESWPTALRGTGYGLSAAFGKAGAAIGTQAFTPIQNHLGKRWTFLIAAMCGLAGILTAFFFIEDKTADDLAKEDEAWRQYLVDQGWDGEMGDGSEELRKACDVKIDNAY